MRLLSFVVAVCFLCPPGALETRAASAAADSTPVKTLDDFQKTAARFKSVLALPRLEATPKEIATSLSNAIHLAEIALKEISSCRHDLLTFENTAGALDDLLYEANLTANRHYLIKETATNAALRDAATEAIKRFQEWAVGLEYREDVFKAIQSYADTKPALEGERAKLLAETLRDYRRAGLPLSKEERAEVERLRKELAGLTTDFQSNITKTEKPVTFTRAELAGVPEDFLKQIKTGEDEYNVKINVTFHYVTVMENGSVEATRKKLLVLQQNLAREKNVPLLGQILELRDRIARKLGYASWADYQIEPKMAKDAATARGFLEKLSAGLQPKFDAELEELRQLKARDTGDPRTQLRVWDWRFYANVLKREKYTVDAEQLRVFFPYDKTLAGMFRVYEQLFGLRLTRIEPTGAWADGVELWAVSDRATHEPLGLFYLDMFPREGKYNHFAQFGIIEGKRLPTGKYQRPTVALICNFPPPTPDKPSLLTHHDVETLFHEFGHALHSILTRADFSRFAGTSVPRDFVEAPSQMLENWVWDKKVLDSFAADYRDPKKKIPKKIIARLKDAKLATVGLHYRRQISFGLVDLALHSQVKDGGKQDVVKLSNKVLNDVFLPLGEDTAFVAYFGHLMGYDAGYYGYAWADAIAADMATLFETARKGYYNEVLGRRLRDEIYAPGDSRDVNESIRRFLGRERSLEPFLKTLGLGAPPKKKA